jgi:hypothetical protein
VRPGRVQESIFFPAEEDAMPETGLIELRTRNGEYSFFRFHFLNNERKLPETAFMADNRQAIGVFYESGKKIFRNF